MTPRALALALAAALAGASLGACTSPNESIGLTMYSVCTLTDDCKFQAKCDAQYIGEIVYDVALASRLWMPIQVNNTLPNNADLSSGRLNTHDAHITTIEITYGGFALASATVGVNYVVPAGGTSIAGVDVVPFQATALAGPATPTQAVAQIVAKGYFDDGSSFETGRFPVSFTYCDGCLAGIYACTTPGDVFEITCGDVGVLPVAGSCVTP